MIKVILFHARIFFARIFLARILLVIWLYYIVSSSKKISNVTSKKRKSIMDTMWQ